MAVCEDLNLYTTSACNARCKDCGVRWMMMEESNYDMTMADVESFVHFTKLAGYVFKRIIITGGEPLLWKSLYDGLKMLKISGVCKEIVLFTNGLAARNGVPKLIEKSLEYADFIRVSVVPGAEQAIPFLKRDFGHKMLAVERKSMLVVPNSPYDGVLPAVCDCAGYALRGSTVYWCSAMPNVIARHWYRREDFGNQIVDLCEDYLEVLPTKGKYERDICRSCISNHKVRKLIPSEPVILGGIGWRKNPEIVLLTAVWKRHSLTKFVLKRYGDIKERISDRFDLRLIAVGSEGNVSKELCEQCGFEYFEFPNLPLNHKWQHGLEQARKSNPDAVVIAGSDDLLSENYFEIIYAKSQEDDCLVGLNDLYFWDDKLDCLWYWEGYAKGTMAGGIDRHNEPIGLGRCFSRRVLEKCDWELWPKRERLNSGLDISCARHLGQLDIKYRAYKMSELDVSGMDIKAAQNLTPIGTYSDNLFLVDDLQTEDVLRSMNALDMWKERVDSKVSTTSSSYKHKIAGSDSIPVVAVESLQHEPLVSVVIPCYNHAHFLVRAVDSVVNQTFKNIEIIVVDDGSPDECSDVVRSLQAQYDDIDIILIGQPNRGLSGARNAGFRAARGKYVLPLDADDYIELDMLAKCIAAFKGNPEVGVVFTDVIKVFSRCEEYWSTEFDIEKIKGNNLLHSGSLIRRSVWETCGGYNESLKKGYEDWDFWLSCAEMDVKFVKVPEALVIYDQSHAGMRYDCYEIRQELHYEVCSNHAEFCRVPEDKLVAVESLQHEPLVSVVIPCWNHASYLERSVGSVMNQTLQDFEIIIVNDGSPDDCDEAVGQLWKQYSKDKIVLVEQSNQGLAAARNTGFRAARGKYVLPLDADDYIELDMLERCVAYMESQSDVGVVYTDVKVLEEDGKEGERIQCFKPQLITNINQICCTALVRKSVWQDTGGYDEKLREGYEDWDFWHSCVENGVKFAKVIGKLFVWDRTKPGSMSKTAEGLFDRIHARIRQNHPKMYGIVYDTEKPYIKVAVMNYNHKTDKLYQNHPKTYGIVYDTEKPYIKVVIMNHNQTEADRLYNQLSPIFDVSVFDSGSDADKVPKCVTHRYDNIYWTGCWNEAMRLFGRDYDVVWVVAADVELLDSPDSYKEAIEISFPFGCWSPSIVGDGRSAMKHSATGGKLCEVYNLEGICMAVSKKVTEAVPSLPAGNDIGWGQDLWLSYMARKIGLKNYLDGRIVVKHPDVSGYNRDEALIGMISMFNRLIGPNWRDEIRHWSNDFGHNLVQEVDGQLEVSESKTIELECEEDTPEMEESKGTIITIGSILPPNNLIEFVDLIMRVEGVKGIIYCGHDNNPSYLKLLRKYISRIKVDVEIRETEDVTDGDIALFTSCGKESINNSIVVRSMGIPIVCKHIANAGVHDIAHEKNGLIYTMPNWALRHINDLFAGKKLEGVPPRGQNKSGRFIFQGSSVQESHSHEHTSVQPDVITPSAIQHSKQIGPPSSGIAESKSTCISAKPSQKVKSQKSIAYVLPLFSLGGSEVHFRNLGREAQRRGYKVGMFAVSDMAQAPSKVNLDWADEVYEQSVSRVAPRFVSMKPELIERLRAYDVIHLANFFEHQRIELKKALPEKRFFETWHAANNIAAMYDDNDVKSDDVAEARFCVSKAVFDLMSKRCDNAIECACALEVPDKIAPLTGHNVVMVGRIEVNKNQTQFVEILSQVPGAKGILIGGHEEGYAAYMEMVKNRAKKLGVDLEITGFVEDVTERLLEADVMLFTSMREGKPLCVAEAQMLGVPIVSRVVGETLELVTRANISGFFYQDVPWAVKYVKELLADKDRARKIGLMDREARRQQYDAKNVFDVHEKHYFGESDRQSVSQLMIEAPKVEAPKVEAPKVEVSKSREVSGVSLIVSSYNQLERLKVLFESLKHQTVFPKEVIIGDDGSNDDTLAWLDSLSDGAFPFPIKYTTWEHNQYRLAAVNNMAANYATGERLVFTNGDLVFSSKVIESHAGLADGVIGAGVIDGIQDAAWRNIDESMLKDATELRKFASENASVYSNREWIERGDPNENFFGIWGGNFSISRAMFDKVTGFNNGYVGWGAEETEFVERALKSGAKAEWLMDAVSYHLDHPRKAYVFQQQGRKKYRIENLGMNKESI